MATSLINNIKTIACITSIGVLSMACATAPMQEMSDARQSVQAAHDVGADKFAPKAMDNAEKTLERAQKNLSKRAFKEARDEAVTAKGEAMKAQQISHAISAAKAAIKKAEQQGAIKQETRNLLSKAEQAANQGDSQQAIDLANEAKLQAEQNI